MAGLVINKLEAQRPGVARFEALCPCGFVTILHVPVAHALGVTAGGFQCDGCGVDHRVAVQVNVNGGP
jgi:hypothetical protein